MYTSPDEARSDLFLSGAVYLFAPLLVQVLFSIVPLGRVPIVGLVLNLLLPLAYTVLVPLLLIRYRKEHLADYGFTEGWAALPRGMLLGLPIALAAFIAGLLASARPGLGVPLVDIALGGSFVLALQRLTSTLGVILLALYGTIKARDAFRSDPRYLRPGVVEIGRILAAVGAAATVLVMLSYAINGDGLLTRATVPLEVVAVAATAALVYRSLRGSQLTTRANLLTPVVLMAIGPFVLPFAGALNFVLGVWKAAVVGAVGLVVGALVESRVPAAVPVGLAVVVALLSYV